MEIDTSEVDELSLFCLENCALCCLCQAELVGEENKSFSKDPLLRGGITKTNIFGVRADNYFLKLKKNVGSCYFLKDRRCTIYHSRPFYCRLFPVHIHVGDRVQLVANLSCRGLNHDGIGLVGHDLAEEALSGARLIGLEEIAREKRISYQEFRSSLLAGENLTRTSLASFSEALLKRFVFQDFVGRTMTYASTGEDDYIALSELEEHLKGLAPLDLREAAVKGATETFSDRELNNIPVWIDKDMRWIIFRIIDGCVEMYQMDDNGALVKLKKIRIGEVGLRSPDGDAERTMTSYAIRLVRRDLTYGYAAYLVKLGAHGAEPIKDFTKMYFGTLGTILLDYWWRTSLLAALGNKRTIDLDTAKEGMIAYDMNYLDLPSLGGFL